MFALSSDDNSEFWLSTDDSPLNVQLSAWVGKVRLSCPAVDGHFLIQFAMLIIILLKQRLRFLLACVRFYQDRHRVDSPGRVH